MENTREREAVLTELTSAIRHSFMYGIGNVLSKALGFLMLPLYTRYLTPADYGILEVLDLSMSLFGMFLSMGLAPAVLRSHAAARSPDDKKRVISTAFAFVIATGLSTFAVGLIFFRPVSTLLLGPNVPPTYLLMSFTSFILAYIAILPRTYLRAMEASGTFSVVDNLGLGLMLTLNIYFVVILKLGLIGILMSTLIVGTIQASWLSVWTIGRVGLRVSVRHLKQLLAFGWPLMFSNLAVFVLNFSDRFFLKHFQSLTVVGLYAVGYKFAFMLNYLLVQPFYIMWQSRMYVVQAQPDYARIFSVIFVLFSFVLICAGLVLSTFSPELVAIMLGPRFAASQNVIPIVVLAYILWGIGFYVQVGMFLTNNTNLIGMVGATSACVNLVANYLLILHFGMLGAAWATLLSFAVLAAGSYWFSQRVFPLNLGIGRVSMALFVAFAIYMLSRWVHPNSLWAALLLKSILVAAFPAFVWKLRILSPSEVTAVLSAKDRTLAHMGRLVDLIWGRAANV